MAFFPKLLRSKPAWRTLEDKANEQIGEAIGASVKPQKVSRTTRKRLDGFVIDGDGDRHIIESKCYKVIERWHVDCAKRYKGFPWFAQHGHLAIPEDAVVSVKVQEYARERGINIVRIKGMYYDGWLVRIRSRL